MIITTNHDEIRKWVEQFKGTPQFIDDPQVKSDKIGLHFHFLGNVSEALLSDANIKNITWESFFEEFENQHLAFLYDENADSQIIQKLDEGYHFIRRSAFEDDSQHRDAREIDDVIKQFTKYDSTRIIS